MVEQLIEIDQKIFLFLNGFHNSLFDIIMWWASKTITWIPLYCFIVYKIIKEYKWKSIVVLFGIALLITLADQISVKCFKEVFQRLRPCHEPSLEGLVHIVNGKCGGNFGFVSSHAANTFATAMLISLLFQKRTFTLLLFCWSAFVSYSRIYLGVHYLGDIFGGAILGCIIGALVYMAIVLGIKKFYRKIPSK